MRPVLFLIFYLCLGVTVNALAADPLYAQITTPTASPSALASPSASESATASSTPSPSPTTLQTQELSGEVVRLEGNILTLKTDTETKELMLNGQIKVTRDGELVGKDQVKPGDKVKATIDQDTGQVLTLEATSAKQAGLANWILPVLIGLALLAGLLYWLMNRQKTGQIKTTTTNLS
jgi:hypothetical protein